jgi:hypothetical protein
MPHPRSNKKGRVSVSVCVCVQAERAMSGTLLLLIAMNSDSFVSSSLVSVVRLAACVFASSRELV